ncbi:NDR1/HIN1-like protein 1 [Silene latifolia]|uniref:NDR1/HIN1-like protein 1 n=1 Tax=Silene latifolia TaxID=37657 RepID=UPI003D770337
MTSKDCCDDDHEPAPLHHRVIGGILFLIFLILFTIFLIWLILRPTKPHFTLQDATIYSFNLTQPNLLSATFQVTLQTRNPNDKIGVYYDRADVYSSYHNQQITLVTRLPPTYQGHKDIVIWSPFLYGVSIPIAPYLGMSLQQDQNAGLLLMNIKINARVRWKVGTWISGKYHMNVNCPAYITFGNNNNNNNYNNKNNNNNNNIGGGNIPGVNFGAVIKYQLSSSCHVDV